MKRNLALLMSLALTVFAAFTAFSVFQAVTAAPNGGAAFAQAKVDSSKASTVSDAALAALAPTDAVSQISPDLAAQIAAQTAASGAVLSGNAELVNFQGTVAYEVVFDSGKIYVDASTGAVLYNGTVSSAPATIGPDQAAFVAATYMGRADIYRVDLVSLGGHDVYRVKFSNGDAIFVDVYGQILQVRLASTGSPSASGNGEGRENEQGSDD
jgi:uncharacterized membrane protein YkoI